MNLRIVAYYLLFVILFTASLAARPGDSHRFFLGFAGGPDWLIVQAPEVNPAIQSGYYFEAGLQYLHPLGINTSLGVGVGSYHQAYSSQGIMYRGFEYRRILGTVGWTGSLSRRLLASAQLEGGAVFARFHSSLQEFFFPEIGLRIGAGTGGRNKLFLSLPVLFQLRPDLSRSISLGLLAEIRSDSSPALFQSEGR